MLSFFNKKSNSQPPKEQQKPENAKSQLDKVKEQENTQVLGNDEMHQVQGGTTASKPFGGVFPWNSSFGGTIPQ